ATALRRPPPTPTPEAGETSGGAGARACDPDRDGKRAYPAAERGASLLHLFSGSSGALIRSMASPANESAGGYFTIAHSDDKDGDGADDFWIGAPLTGTVSLLNATGTVLAQASDPAPGGGRFGSSLASTGDLDGDGRREAVVGAPEQAVGAQLGAGRAFVLALNRPPVADAGPDQVVPAGLGCL